MFPSFRDSKDREQKRQDLLAKVERRVRNNSIKRGMYEDAIWASDATKTVDLKPANSSEVQTEPMSQLDTLKKVQPYMKAIFRLA